ncbi:MAG: c-type cytochrome [Bradyrhizobium sp.]
MHRARKPCILICALAAWLSGIGSSGAEHPDRQAFEQIEKGHYLATVADCYACHTVPNVGKPFAGGRAIETPFGVIISSNITPDADTGIGAWTDQQFDDAVRKGVRPDGGRLYPAMPFPAYTKMSHDDVLAIRAYLATVELVHQPVKSNTLPFPFNIREAMRLWDALYFKEGEFQPDSQQSPAWNRGAYLVQGPGHCTSCHTPKSLLGGDKTNDNLRGFNLQGWFAPDITGGNNQGLGQWSEADITGYLQTGHNRITAATGPMAEEVVDATSQYSDSDLTAIAIYLKSLPQRNDQAAPPRAESSVMTAGQAIYRDECSACHGIDGRGVPMMFPSLAQSSLAHASDPTSAIRLVLRGGRSVATNPEPTSPGMPSYGWQLNDDQVASVLTYIRNAWQTSAAPVSAEMVGKARDQLRTRSD